MNVPLPLLIFNPVTLHVSVWVEIALPLPIKTVLCVTLHVSVWVEMSIRPTFACESVSRSTWACELKCMYQVGTLQNQLSRSTWACELKLQCRPRRLWTHTSRSTWACELKCFEYIIIIYSFCHAPRERVSWNARYKSVPIKCWVTLHVSVWVEIQFSRCQEIFQPSRSTWACELKFQRFAA